VGAQCVDQLGLPGDQRPAHLVNRQGALLFLVIALTLRVDIPWTYTSNSAAVSAFSERW
jgi:hypothetical protein